MAGLWDCLECDAVGIADSQLQALADFLNHHHFTREGDAA